MRVYDMIVSERLEMADFLGGLTEEQLSAQSLCERWTIHDVAAHLISYLRFGQLKVYAGVITGLGDIGPMNELLARRIGRMPSARIIELMREHADSRTTVPRSGYDPILADMMVHDQDIRIPLGLSRAVPEERLWVTFNHLTDRASPGFAIGSRLDGLRIEAADTGWTVGGRGGLLVRGPAESVVLAMTGRPAGFRPLEGDGVAVLRERIAAPRIRADKRLKTVLGLLVKPSDRIGKELGAPPMPAVPDTRAADTRKGDA